MGEFADFFKQKKNLISLLILGILILAVPIGINLIRQTQIFKSRATGEPIAIKESTGVFRRTKPDGTLEWVANKGARVSLELNSPLGSPFPNQSPVPSPSPSPAGGSI